MHFGDFLIQLLNFIYTSICSVCTFLYEYVIPIASFALPILIDGTCQVVSFIIRLFFTYISPCLIFILDWIIWFFSNALNAIGYICITIMDFETSVLDGSVLVFICIVVGFIYLQYTEKLMKLFYEFFQLILFNCRFFVRIVNLVMNFVIFLYKKLEGKYWRKSQVQEMNKTKNL